MSRIGEALAAWVFGISHRPGPAYRPTLPVPTHPGILLRVSTEDGDLIWQDSEFMYHVARARAGAGWHELLRTTDKLVIAVKAVEISDHDALRYVENPE